MTKDEIWGIIFSFLGDKDLASMMIRPEQTPQEWIETLCRETARSLDHRCED